MRLIFCILFVVINFFLYLFNLIYKVDGRDSVYLSTTFNIFDREQEYNPYSYKGNECYYHYIYKLPNI